MHKMDRRIDLSAMVKVAGDKGATQSLINVKYTGIVIEPSCSFNSKTQFMILIPLKKDSREDH